MKKFKALTTLVNHAKESGCEIFKKSDIYLLTEAYQQEYDRLCDEEDLYGEENEYYVSKERYDLKGGFWMQASGEGIFYWGMTMAEVYETLNEDSVGDQYGHLFGDKPLSPQELDFLAIIQAS